MKQLNSFLLAKKQPSLADCSAGRSCCDSCSTVVSLPVPTCALQKIRADALPIIDSSQSEREFRNLAAPRFPENHGVTIFIEF